MTREFKWICRAIMTTALAGVLGGCASDMIGVISSDVAAFRRVESSKGAIPPAVLAQARGVATHLRAPTTPYFPPNGSNKYSGTLIYN